MVITPSQEYQVYEATTDKVKEVSLVISSGAIFGGIVGYLTFLPVGLCIVSAVALGLYNMK